MIRYWLWRYTKGIRIVGLGPIRGNDGATPRERKQAAERFYETIGRRDR